MTSAVATPLVDSRDEPSATADTPKRSQARRRGCFWWTLLAATGLLIALAAPALTGRIYTADDLGAFHLPLRAFYQDCLARGERFDWSPQLYCGFYLTGEGQVGTYHPWHRLLYRFLPLSTAFDIECLANYPLLLLGMYCLLRRWRFRSDAALFGAMAFTFSGFCLLHFVHVNAIAVVAHLPWLLIAIDVTLRSSRSPRRAIAGTVLALLTASQILLGYPQYVGLSLIVEIGYAVLLLKGSFPLRWGKDTAILLFWLFVGVAIGGVQLLPTWDALQESSRQGADTSFSSSGSLAPLNVVQFIAPYLFRTRVVGQNTHELGLYAGSVTLLLAVWCVLGRNTPTRFKPLVRAALALLAFGFLFALGEHGPLQPLLAWLPVVNKFRFPCRAILLVQFSLAVVAAVGFMTLGEEQPHSAEPIGPTPRRSGNGVITVWLLAAGTCAAGNHWTNLLARIRCRASLDCCGSIARHGRGNADHTDRQRISLGTPSARGARRDRSGRLRIELCRISAIDHARPIHRRTSWPAGSAERPGGRRSGAAHFAGPSPGKRITAFRLASR